MNRKEKEELISVLSKRFVRANAVILTDFSGLKVEQMNELRQKMRASNLEYLVVKNTLLKLSAKGSNIESLTDDLRGPNGLACSYDDQVKLAKVLVDFSKANPKLEIKGGALGNKLISNEEILVLAKLPGREILLAQFVGVMSGVIRNFVGTLAAMSRNFVNVLARIKEEKEEIVEK